jgi:hypothetical protein
MADSYDPTVIRGDTLRWTMSLTNSSGNTYDLTGSTLAMQIRSGYYPSKLLTSYEISITAGSQLETLEGQTGGLSATGTGGVILVCVGSNYTKNFPAYTNIFYDIEQKTATNNNTITLLSGRINTVLDVTRP